MEACALDAVAVADGGVVADAAAVAVASAAVGAAGVSPGLPDPVDTKAGPEQPATRMVEPIRATANGHFIGRLSLSGRFELGRRKWQISLNRHASRMDDRRVGRAIRAIRRRRAWRQEDLAAAARVSQTVVSDIELGRLEAVSLTSLRRVAGALDARVTIDLSWRGAAVDRLLDERHSALVESTLRQLSGRWDCAVEVSYAYFGERGSVDVLAWDAVSETLLVIEVKSEIGSVEETLRRFDVKARLAPRIAAERGWHPKTIARLLVIGDFGCRPSSDRKPWFHLRRGTPGSRLGGEKVAG